MADADLQTEQAHEVEVPGWLVAMCRWLAGIGGLVLMAMMLMTVISVTRRSLFGAPIPGDFELVELGSAILIACFLPWCQISGGNVLVDFFTMRAGPRLNHMLEAVGDLLYLLIGVLLTWRMWHGVTEFYGYGEQSMVLRLPVWISAALMLPAFALLILATFYTMIGHVRAARA
ncbi:TRAP-type mannitol/chloroaromatic compound transport system, small permease component [Paracoccus isoporae]|uniref:TRAP transporter small permease protein n=1 Tax=Paracoccus isoporae TaxID=591205 RepID=A0A1G6TYF1_9RHOB|nr:TRAP transporter small permease [Paracoccus isoporae]SDD34093.1 TRAP-type mannitol/chloroaromatic compound transport system, small permease component [Paracoccus isoporae]